MDVAVPFDDARRVLDVGLKYLPEGDSPERVQLLAVDASWPFGFPDRHYSDEDLERFAETGLEAASIARRLGRLDLESAALDNASSGFGYRGRYGDALRLQERRVALLPRLNDLLEIGDTYSMLAWTHAELGHPRQAVRWSDAGMEALADEAPNVHAHLLAWLSWGRFRLGRWDESLDAYRRLRDALEERADVPPNFVTHAYGTAALIHERRGERAEGDRAVGALQEVLRRAGKSATRPWAWMLPVLVARGELEEVRRQLYDRPGAWRVHVFVVLEAAAERVIAGRAWDEAPEVIGEMRDGARTGDLDGLAAVADELEGLAAVASGDARGVGLIEAARRRYADLGEVWHVARCDLEVAETVRTSALDRERRRRVREATAVFERLRSVAELERIRDLTRDS
jgi:tetratricopeptide (TPR) repeat protein